ncbi:MAG: type II toxin-antitoxin system HicA family toxin [Acidobacteriota bacterium]
MKAISGKDFARLLERHGWSLLRINGSHHIYGKPAAKPESRFRSMGIKPSRQVCYGTS